MKKLFLTALLAYFVIPTFEANSKVSDYKRFFEVNLEQNYPPLKELEAKAQANSFYDKGYDYTWNIGKKFKTAFRKIITSYGMSEKRLKTYNEDVLLEAIQMLPPTVYPYIGPYIHTVPGISDKIKNYPGIKETKNQFPQQIAPELSHIEGIEYLSPALYYALMPQIWQSQRAIEKPVYTDQAPKAKFDPKFFENLSRYAPLEKYIPKTQKQIKKKFSADELRTIHPTPTSPLRSADIQAVMKTLPEISQLGKDIRTTSSLLKAGHLLDIWESENNLSLPISSGIKDMANPCQRLIQKFQIIGESEKLSRIVAKQGFDLKEWGYTCDKTIKAYRASTMSPETAVSIRAFKNGSYQPIIDKLPPQTAKASEALMQGIIEMYDVPLADVATFIKNKQANTDSLHQIDDVLLFHPLSGLD